MSSGLVSWAWMGYTLEADHLIEPFPMQDTRLNPSVWLVLMLFVATGCQESAPIPHDVVFGEPVVLEAEPHLSANAEIADFNQDGHMDVVLAIGRHWPRQNMILFGDGTGAFTRVDTLSSPGDRTYSMSAADLDGDGDLDLVVSNDRPDINYILFNDGDGGFGERMDFGDADWPTRNSTVADVNHDGRPDILVANRSGDPRTEALEPGSLALGGDNYVCINEPGSPISITCHAFSSGSATTIAAADLNDDDVIDVIVPYRDGGQSHVFLGDGTGVFNAYIPFGPDNASFRAALAVDANRDGLVDIVAINDRERTTTLFLQVQPFGFDEGTRVDQGEAMPYALEVADINGDAHEDIIVGYRQAPTILFLNGETGLEQMVIGDSLGAAYGYGTGDVNGDGRIDIAQARSGASDLLFPSSESR